MILMKQLKLGSESILSDQSRAQLEVPPALFSGRVLRDFHWASNQCAVSKGDSSRRIN